MTSTPTDGSADAAATIAAGAAARPAPSTVVRTSIADAAELAARRSAELLVAASAERGSGHLVLTGGSGGQAIAGVLPGALAEAGLAPGAGLDRIHLWFGDERFVPQGHPERNDLLVSGLLEAGFPEENVHRVAGPDAVPSPEEAAEALARDIEENGPGDGRFDVVHLGLGPDAHVCSLFPGHPAALALRTTTVAVRSSPKPPPERVSLTFEVLQAAREIMVIAGGSGKVSAVSLGLGEPDPVRAPASCARGERTSWYLDAAAASEMPR